MKRCKECEIETDGLIDGRCYECDQIGLEYMDTSNRIATNTGMASELAALRTDRDELRRVLDQMLIAWGTGELACDVINGRWWPALEDAKKLLEARP